MHALAKTRVNQMARNTNTTLTQVHMDVLEYAWNYYRQNSIGPLYHNIEKNTGVSRVEIDRIFPHGIASVHMWAGIPIHGSQSGCKPMALLELEHIREVYLDYNATTPLRPEVITAMTEFLRDPKSFGNPSSAYFVGSAAYDVVERARTQIADCLGAASSEIIFTGSGSEANNLALRGMAETHAPEGGHIITSRVEHPSVLRTLGYLETQGYAVTYLDVHHDGTLTARDVETALRPDTFLVSVMAANNEIGTIYPIGEIGSLCRQKRIVFMTDAVQAFGKIPINPKNAGISMLSGSGHKIYGPKGIGFLFLESGLTIGRQIHGGGQERKMRAGTENVVGIMALGIAASLACKEMENERKRHLHLRRYFLDKLRICDPNAIINGTLEQRLPHNLSVAFSGVDSGSLLLSLNQIGVCVSAGSACSASENKVSHVLAAIGADETRRGTVRISFGRSTNEEDIDYLFTHLPKILAMLREQKNESDGNVSLSREERTCVV